MDAIDNFTCLCLPSYGGDLCEIGRAVSASANVTNGCTHSSFLTLLPNHRFQAWTGAPGLPGAPFWGTQLRSLPPAPIFTACSCSFPTSEMLADLTAGEMYTLETGAQGAGHTLTFSRACGLADVTTELSAWVPTRTTQLILCIGHGERDG